MVHTIAPHAHHWRRRHPVHALDHALRRFEDRAMALLREAADRQTRHAPTNLTRHLDPEGRRLAGLARHAAMTNAATTGLLGDIKGCATGACGVTG